MLVNMRTLLEKARSGGYGVPMFDTMNTDMIKGVINAAEEASSPVILAYFDGFVPYAEAELVGPQLIRAAERAEVPVAVHLDHGTSLDLVKRALSEGFTSVMIDASEKPYEYNAQLTGEAVAIAKGYGASVEGEIGHVAGQEYFSRNDSEYFYTEPEDAVKYVADTGVDALAVSIGSVHGLYIKKPQLDFSRLSAIRSAVDIPLVLHGGSGISDDDFRKLIECGISKLNIFTDLTIAALNSMRSGTGVLSSSMYLQKTGEVINAVKAAALKKMQVFGSTGKA